MPGRLALAAESFQFRRHGSPVDVILLVVSRFHTDERSVAACAMDCRPREGGHEASSLGVNCQLYTDPLATVDLVVNDHRRLVGHQRLDRHRDILLEGWRAVALGVFQRLFSSVANALVYAADINPLSRFWTR